MTNQFPPADWHLRPDEWPYWSPNTLPSSGLMPTRPFDFPWNRSAPAWSLSAMPSSSNSGILGDFGQAGGWNDPQTTIPHQGAWDPPVPPIPFAPPAAFSLPVLPAMRAPGLNAAGYSPLYDAAPQPSAWDTFISPIDHLESAKYLGAASMTPQAGSEQMPSSDYDLSPVPRPPSWETINRANGERSALFPDPPLSFWGAPARSLEGQQQTRGGSGTHESVPDILSDVTPDNHWIPGADYAGVGHHHNPRGVYGKFDLPKETRRVFDKAATGPLPFHGWHQFDELHRLYNAAIEDLMNRFMQEYNIKAPQMTPDHARSVLKAIADSDDPRIRVYRAMLQYMGRLYRLRTGVRGSE